MRHLSLSKNRKVEKEKLLEEFYANKQKAKRKGTFEQSDNISLLLEEANQLGNEPEVTPVPAPRER